jgi:hypothetical protein
MKNKSQNQVKATPMARAAELKHSVSMVAARKNLADVGIVFDGWPLRNCSHFQMDSSGQRGRNFPNAFCFTMKPLPVCLRAGFRFDGRINDRDKEHFVSF